MTTIYLEVTDLPATPPSTAPSNNLQETRPSPKKVQSKEETPPAYKLYLYPEHVAPGAGYSCETRLCTTLAEAQRVGRAANVTFYEIQSLTGAGIVERKTLRLPQWALKTPSPTGLRFQHGLNGYFQFRLSDTDALRAAVALRHLGLGLCWRPGRQMITAKVTALDAAQKLLSRL